MTHFSAPAPSSTSTKPLINLLRGWPNPSLLPTQLLQTATQTVLSDPSIANPALLYGPDAGSPLLRSELAKWLNEFYYQGQKDAPTPDEERITITGGASQSLGVLLSVFTDPHVTVRVWCVAPCYMLAKRIFEDAGLGQALRGVREDEEGLDIKHLEKMLSHPEQDWNIGPGYDMPSFKPDRPYAKLYKHVIYAVPTFSNPTGKTMSLARRKQLVLLARRFNALIITDDVYDFLRWPSAPESSSTLPNPLPRIVDIDRTLSGGPSRPDADGFGNAVSNGSFSKIAGPGLRTGWIEAAPPLAYGASQAGTSRSGGAPSQYTATLLSTLLQTHTLQTHITQTLIPAYTRRYHILLSAIHKHLFPLGVSIPSLGHSPTPFSPCPTPPTPPIPVNNPATNPAGGYFIWLALPRNGKGAIVSAKTLARRARASNVIVAEGEMFAARGVDCWGFIRVCFAWEEEENLEEGVRRLGVVLKGMLDEGEELGAGVDDDDNGDRKY